MDYADAIRRQAEDAPRVALPAVAKAMWSAFAAGQITEDEAEALSALIEARQVPRPPVLGSANLNAPDPAPSNGLPRSGGTPQDRQNAPRTGVGSRPVSSASLERRRRWAASGRLPPTIAARFTLAEQAVLALIAAESARKGDCRLSVPHLAAVAGVAETTVRNAIREARKVGLLTVEERRLTGYRNDTNVVRIVSPEWTAWLRLARKGVPRFGETSPRRGGGCKSPHRTPTQVSKQGKTRSVRGSRRQLAGPAAPLQVSSRIADA